MVRDRLHIDGKIVGHSHADDPAPARAECRGPIIVDMRTEFDYQITRGGSFGPIEHRAWHIVRRSRPAIDHKTVRYLWQALQQHQQKQRVLS